MKEKWIKVWLATALLFLVLPVSSGSALYNLMQVGTSSDTNSVTLNWLNDSGETSYSIYRDGTYIGSTANITYKATGLQPCSTYNFRVTSNTGSNKSITAYTEGCTPNPQLAPPAPTGLVLTSTESSITARWNGSSSAEYYNIYINGERRFSTTSTSYTLDNLQYSRTYTIGIQAENRYGTSAVTSAQIRTKSAQVFTAFLSGNIIWTAFIRAARTRP
jgi:hypothetical protein